MVVNKSSGITLTDDLTTDSLTISAGNFDANDFNVIVSGDVLMSAGTRTWMGAGTWTCGGNWNHTNCTNLYGETSELIFTGSSKTLRFFNSLIKAPYNVTIASGASVTFTGQHPWIENRLKVIGTVTSTAIYIMELSELTVEAT